MKIHGGTKMKATGIVRRIDDLGRVVIPKEIRRTMRIREGDPLLTALTPDSPMAFMGVIVELGRRLGEKST
jgi:AbrB family looped-hinge helix DNA binding protein